MGIFLGILIGLTAIGLVLLLRSLTTLIHELGHALPALIFTTEDVTVHIGSYGQLANSFQFQLGRLRIYFRLNLLDWKIGMCQHGGVDHWWKHLMVILCGPIASILISVPLLFIIFRFDISQTWIAIFSIFIIAALIDFFVNIIPISREIKMFDGSTIYNDGYQIYLMLSRLFLSKEYLELEDKLLHEKYDEVIQDGKRVLENTPNDRGIYALIIEACMHLKDYEEALSYYKIIKSQFKLNTKDYRQIGKIYMGMNNYPEALKYFDHCYYKNFQDPLLLNDLGYLKIQQGEHEEAIKNLNAAIYYSPDLIDAYLNHGLANIRLEQYEAAQQSLNQAERIQQQHPFLAFYRGVLFEAQDKFTEALEQYEQADLLKCNHHGLAFRTEQVRGWLERERN